MDGLEMAIKMEVVLDNMVFIKNKPDKDTLPVGTALNVGSRIP